MEECKHKWKTLSWKPDGCGCCGELEAVCVECEETIHEYLSFWQIEDLELDEEDE